jgi:two-component system, OmpR family, sensor histidine kinase MtrB
MSRVHPGNMKVKTATFLLAALILGLFILLGGSLIRMTSLLDEEANALGMAGESISVVKELRSYLLSHNREDFLFSLQSADNQVLGREIDGLIARMEMLVTSEQENAVLTELKTEIAAYLAKLDRIEKSALSALERYKEATEDVQKPLAVVYKLIDINQTEMDALVQTIDKLNRTADRIAFLLLALGGIVLLCLMGMMFFYIAYPLKSVAKTISRFSAGDTSVRVKPAGLMEISQIGANFNSMADRLQENQQEQLRFIAAIAHDLRNPLYSISMTSELLNLKGDPEYRNLANIISRQVKNLDRMVGDLLDTARIEARQIDLDFSSHDINSLIMDAVQLHGTGADMHRFKLDLPDEPLLCECDGGRISQVLNNLLSNAIKYSPNGGTITVKAHRVGDEAVVSVTDEGIGIAPKDLNNIFKPFNRTTETRRTIPGIGLGLSTSRRIVEGHGGKFMVNSELRSGSTFYFTLPIKPRISRGLETARKDSRISTH